MTDHPHSALRPVEGRIWRAVMQAAETESRTLEIDAATMPVRGAFLAWLLAEGAAKAAPLPVQLTLLGASIEAPLDLRGLRLTLTPRLVGCKLPSIDLRDAAVVGFEMLAGSVTSISADRLSATSSLAIRETSDRDAVPEHYRGRPSIERQLRLNGATIRGNLDLRGCTIRGEGQDDGRRAFCRRLDGERERAPQLSIQSNRGSAAERQPLPKTSRSFRRQAAGTPHLQLVRQRQPDRRQPLSLPDETLVDLPRQRQLQIDRRHYGRRRAHRRGP